jgi:geranylgeranyl diphosphate synthase type I
VCHTVSTTSSSGVQRAHVGRARANVTSTVEVSRRSRTSPDDDVVLLDGHGRPSGRARKSAIHGLDTPFHLAISCYVVRSDGRLLITRRAAAKKTWPGAWTNACCGHPRPDESLESAVRRHLYDELSLCADRLRVVLPDFTYRAMMDNGRVEHELCPVFIAEVSDDAVMDPDEADALEWVTWAELQRRAADPGSGLSPWSRTQIGRIAQITADPLAWVSHRPNRAPVRHPDVGANDPFVAMGSRVDDLIEEFIETASDLLGQFDPMAIELAAPIRALFRAGGKRLRPCLVYCGFEAVAPVGELSADVRGDLDAIAAAVEMLHTFALLHDDVMDRSATRRGHATAHIAFTELHASSAAVGDSEWFGTSAALVAGDLAFVWADQLLDRIGCNSPVAMRVRSVFNTLRNEVIAGQYMDLRLAGASASDQQALAVALLKSGRYTVTRPLEIGATLAGADETILAALRGFGDAVGIAFQLRDDVLGVFGNPQLTGKGASEDLTSGKGSLLLVRALELAAPAERAILRSYLGRADLDCTEVEACRRAVEASGALASIEALIDAKLLEADRILAELPDAVANQLSTLSRSLTHRAA